MPDIRKRSKRYDLQMHRGKKGAETATRVRSIRHFNRTRNACDDHPFRTVRPSTFRARTRVLVRRDRHVRHNRHPCRSAPSPLRDPTIRRSPRTQAQTYGQSHCGTRGPMSGSSPFVPFASIYRSRVLSGFLALAGRVSATVSDRV